jgi:glycosyltransferase involved in cell wall biosynthesis
MLPFVSYIICTYNRANYIPIALKAFTTQNGNHYNDFEVVIIDNNSTDSTSEVVHKFKNQNPHIKLIYEKEQKQGLSNARNKGIEVSNSEWIAFLDDDAYISNDYTSNLINFIQNLGTIYKAIGGPILLDFEKKPPHWYTNLLGSLFGYFKPYNHSREFSHTYYPRGSNMIFHRSLFEKYGYFNPKLGRIRKNMLGSEEKDMFQRIYKGKEKVYYLSTIVIYHLVPEYRTQIDFIKKQSIGVGLSEQLRLKNEKFGFLTKIFSEFYKWAISILLLLFYTICFNPAKGIMLIKFRYWILVGLLSKNLEI